MPSVALHVVVPPPTAEPPVTLDASPLKGVPLRRCRSRPSRDIAPYEMKRVASSDVQTPCTMLAGQLATGLGLPSCEPPETSEPSKSQQRKKPTKGGAKSTPSRAKGVAKSGARTTPKPARPPPAVVPQHALSVAIPKERQVAALPPRTSIVTVAFGRRRVMPLK